MAPRSRARAPSRALRTALVLVAALPLAACGATAPPATAEDSVGSAVASTEGAASAASAGAAEQALEFGPLEPTVRYVIDGPPSISFVPHVEMNAFPSAGGALVSIGEVGVRFASGITDVYVGRGEQEPLGDDLAAILEAFARNERIAISETGMTEIGGSEAAYADFTLPFDANVEGGAPILSADASPLFLPDLTESRAFLIDHADGLAVVVVSGPEEKGLDSTLEEVDELIASIEVGGGN